MANHVIFLQPYYTTGENAQLAYDAAMTQAIGRARRYGQMKKVYVYHFLTANTIDVDYFESRRNVILPRQGTSVELRSRGQETPAGENWRTSLGTWFAKQMKFDDVLRQD